jgi:selenide,water dikinase
VSLDPALDLTDRALLTDPQTSGGLLVACAPEAVAEVLAIFEDEGFGEAADIGGVEAAESPRLEVRAGR